MGKVPGLVDLDPTTSALVAAGVELAVIVGLCGLIYLLLWLVVLRPSRRRDGWLSAWSDAAQMKTRNLLLVGASLASAAVLAYNGWLLAQGVDAVADTTARLRALTVVSETDLWIALAKGAAAIAAAVVVTRILRDIMGALERAINRWDQLKDNNRSLARLFRGLHRAIGHVGWLLVAVFACGLVGAPQDVTDFALLILRVYLVFAVGLAAVRSTAVATDTLDGLSRRFAETRGWLRFYEHLRALLPTFRLCLEYALWIGLASLVLVQLEPVRELAVWGPRLIQAIGLFFLGRLVIELGRVELEDRKSVV